jgi:hypothetical protein
MQMRSISFALTVLCAAACLTACDALVTAEDRGDVVFGVHGQALSRTSGAPASEYEVGVLFMRVLYPARPGSNPKGQLETEFVRGTITGDFPAQFRVELTRRPAAYPYNTNIIYLNLDGTQSDGVFYGANAPDGVRIGQLTIGPADELAALPSSIEVPLQQRTFGGALAPYLVKTTITSYQVIYAEGVGPGDVIYPTYNGGKIMGGKPISNGFTLVDARTYFTSILWQECTNGLLPAIYMDPAYSACVAANSGRIGCNENCTHLIPDPGAYEACLAQCAASFPGQLDRNGCLFQVAGPQIDATCGPERTPHPDQLRILNELDSLSVVLGDGSR